MATSQDFIGVPLEENGGFYNRNLDEDYLTWVKAFNTVYRDGAISDDSFADDGTAFEEKVKAGKYATIMLDGTPRGRKPAELLQQQQRQRIHRN